MRKMRLTRSQTISFSAGVIVALAVIAAIYAGSGKLSRFDTPLAAYAAATVFAAFAMAYRYSMWVQRPPTWRYFKATWKLFLRPRSLAKNFVKLVGPKQILGSADFPHVHYAGGQLGEGFTYLREHPALSADEKRLILGENAIGFYSLKGFAS